MLPFKFLKKKSCICKHTMSDKVRHNRVNDNTQIDRWRPILFKRFWYMLGVISKSKRPAPLLMGAGPPWLLSCHR